LDSGTEAVLKPPQSTRYRDCRVASNFAKRLDCGAFTAALLQPTMSGRFREFPLASPKVTN
jgi:hypothetical protein